MTILITGVTGFVGRKLAKILSESFEVWGLSRKRVEDKVFKLIVGDLLDIEDIKKKFTEVGLYKVDVVINLAAITAGPDNIKSIQVLNKNNELSYNAALLSEYLNCQTVINLSSSSVYPNVTGDFDEGAMINPAINLDSFYGLAKFNSEIILNTLLSSKKRLIHLRCGMVYGEGVPSHRIWPVMMKELEGKNTISVYGGGKRFINQIDVDSLSSKIIKLIKSNLSGVFNMKDETLTVRELADRIISEHGNSESRIITIDDGNSSEFYLNCSKFSSLI